MNLYKEMLIKEGFTEGNAERLSNAIDILHSAISKMDKEQLNLFVRSSNISTKLEEFAKIEELYIFRIDNIPKS